MNDVFKKFVALVLSLFLVVTMYAQGIFLEAGVSIGNVLEEEHRQGKGGVHASILYPLKKGKLGLDFAFGGKFIPISENTEVSGVDIVNPKDSKFFMLSFLYRLPLHKVLFIEPRVGYSLLYSYVHTAEETKIQKSNLGAGIGLGGQFSNFSLSLGYQYLGATKEFEGVRENSNMPVRSVSGTVSMIMLRLSYRFSLDDIY